MADDTAAILREVLDRLDALAVKVDRLLAIRERGGTHDAELVAAAPTLVRQVLDELRTNRRVAPPALRPGDSDLLQSILSVLVTEFPVGRNFTVAEIMTKARSNQDLRSLILTAFGAVEDSSKRLGRLLARGEGFRVSGARLVRLAETRDGVLWQLDGS